MTKKEISEIKKTLSSKKCCIDKVSACYVTPEKDKVIIPMNHFFSSGEEEMEKYLEIFKKCLSGNIGKALNTLEFPREAEEEGMQQAFLYNLKQSGLKDEKLTEELFDKIIDCYDTPDYYCILIMHGNYDVMTKGSDDANIDSDTVYSHLIVAICPVNLSKPGLAYVPDKNELKDSVRNWIVEMPTFGFLFPAFTDRQSDIHAVLTYTKKSSDVTDVVIENVLGCQIPISSEIQAEGFAQATLAAFDNSITFDQASSINTTLYEQISEHDAENNEEPMFINKDSMKNLLENNDASSIDSFEEKYGELFDDKELFVENLLDKKKYVVKTENVTITANPLYAGSIRVQEVNGVRCIVIVPDGDIEVNGLVTRG